MRTTTQYFALAYGIAFTLVALAGFVSHGVDQHHQVLILGVFPVNALHSLAHLLIGLGGFAVFFGPPLSAVYYARIVGFAYLLLGVVGIFEPDFFGLMPIGGADIALHLVAGGAALYFGYAHRLAATRSPLSHP